MSRVHIAALAGVVGLVACGPLDESGSARSPLEGTFSLTTRTYNSAGCDVEGQPAAGGDAFFKLVLTPDGGSLQYHPCTSAQACGPADPARSATVREQGDVWRGETKSATYSLACCSCGGGGVGPAVCRNAHCTLSINERTFATVSGALRFERREHWLSDEGMSSAQCTEAAVEPKRTLMTACDLEVIVASRVP